MAFDLAHPDDGEPGAHPDAPYKMQHRLAEEIERDMAGLFGVGWEAYEDACTLAGKDYP